MLPLRIAVAKIPTETRPFPFLLMLFGTFALGLSVGVFVSFYNGEQMLPNPGNQLGAVALSEQSSEDASTTETAAPSSADPAVSKDSFTQSPNESADREVTPPPTPIPFVSPDELLLTIDRMTKELEHVKNESIELIAAFNQNCGNWKDTCATAYADALEKNNASYERLTRALGTLRKETNE
jgi:hypothetical protein